MVPIRAVSRALEHSPNSSVVIDQNYAGPVERIQDRAQSAVEGDAPIGFEPT